VVTAVPAETDRAEQGALGFVGNAERAITRTTSLAIARASISSLDTTTVCCCTPTAMSRLASAPERREPGAGRAAKFGQRSSSRTRKRAILAYHIIMYVAMFGSDMIVYTLPAVLAVTRR
jgi:hypothetical protein